MSLFEEREENAPDAPFVANVTIGRGEDEPDRRRIVFHGRPLGEALKNLAENPAFDGLGEEGRFAAIIQIIDPGRGVVMETIPGARVTSRQEICSPCFDAEKGPWRFGAAMR